MPRPTLNAARTRDDLAVLRPDLIGRYDAELPGARAAVLARLLGAVDREALPGRTAHGSGEATFANEPAPVGKDPRFAQAPNLARQAGLARQAEIAREPAVFGRAASGDAGRRTAGIDLRFPAAASTPFAPGEAGLTVQADVDGTTREIQDPGDLVRLLWPGGPLAAEVDNSVANLALARAGRARPRPGEVDLGRLEQLVTDGHPLHPCCRTRGGMTVADVLAYAPEHSPVIRLRRLRVPGDRWYGTAPPVLLAHPWQAGRLREHHPWLIDDGETGPARPLMSLRTVAPLDGGPHVKTAVDVQMTSAVRTVSPAAVHNAPVLSALLAKLTADLPITVLAETAAGAVIVDGQPQRHLAYLTRDAPALDRGEVAVPLATLSAVPMLLLGGHDAYEIMGLLGDLLFAPLMTVLARGVALEAHGQNTLVVLRGGRPVRTLYRDLGGVRVSAARLGRAGFEAPPLHGDLPNDDPDVLRTKLAASALGTVAAELIATLTRHRGADPDRLWGIVAAAIRHTPDGPRMIRDPLPVKATTAMRLAADPLDDLWARLDNPLAAHA